MVSRPIAQCFVWKEKSLLVLLGWTALIVLIISSLFNNIRLGTATIVLPAGAVIREDFNGDVPSELWTSPPVVGSGTKMCCIYPDQ